MVVIFFLSVVAVRYRQLLSILPQSEPPNYVLLIALSAKLKNWPPVLQLIMDAPLAIVA